MVLCRFVRMNETMNEEELQKLWNAYKAGKPVVCPEDQDMMAVNVDSSTSSYRLVCVKCGFSSPWFSANLTGIRIRGRSSRPPRSTRQDM